MFQLHASVQQGRREIHEAATRAFEPAAKLEEDFRHAWFAHIQSVPVSTPGACASQEVKRLRHQVGLLRRQQETSMQIYNALLRPIAAGHRAEADALRREIDRLRVPIALAGGSAAHPAGGVEADMETITAGHRAEVEALQREISQLRTQVAHAAPTEPPAVGPFTPDRHRSAPPVDTAMGEAGNQSPGNPYLVAMKYV